MQLRKNLTIRALDRDVKCGMLLSPGLHKLCAENGGMEYSMKLNLGNQIRLNRRRMNLTQEQLAEKFGTSPQAISLWEIGATYPDIEMLPMIASFFETSVDALLGVPEEEKEKFCTELQKSFEAAVRAKDVDRTIEIMREIRCNL